MDIRQQLKDDLRTSLGNERIAQQDVTQAESAVVEARTRAEASRANTDALIDEIVDRALDATPPNDEGTEGEEIVGEQVNE